MFVAFLTMAAFSAAYAWKVDAETAVAEGTTLIDDDALKITLPFTSYKSGSKQTIAGESFTHYLQIRTTNWPTAANPNGDQYKNDKGNPTASSLRVEVKKNVALKIYYRRQSTKQTDNKGTYAAGDGKDLVVYDQSDLSKVATTWTLDNETADGKYGYGTLDVNLKKGKTYTVVCKGTTVQFFGFTYEEESQKLYIVGSTVNGWKGTGLGEFTYNEETAAFEYDLNTKGTDYFAISDVSKFDDSGDWSDFNTNHRFAISEGNVNVTIGKEAQLQQVNGTMVLQNAGSYKISITKDMKMTVTSYDKFYLTGSFNEWNLTNMPKFIWNKEKQVHQYEIQVVKDPVLFAISDVATVNMKDFYAEHCYALGNEETEAVIGEAKDLVKTTNSSAAIKLSTPGKYLLSLTDDLKLTISKVYEDVEVNAAPGDIAEAIKTASEGKFVGNLTLNLQNGDYTITEPITVAGNFQLSGSGATINVDEAMTGNFVTLDGTDVFAKKADGTDSDHKLIAKVEFNNVTILGLKGALVKDNQKTLLENLNIINSVIEMPTNKNVIDFNGKGYVGKVTVANSTIYAKEKNTSFFAQYGSRPKNVNGDWKQVFSVENSTIVNIANGKNFCDLKQNGTAQNVYVIKNNIFVDCGKSGQVVVGFNKGQASATPVWEVSGNSFNFGGAETNAAEISKAGQKEKVDIVQNCVPGVVEFADAANGDFTLGYCLQKLMNCGDPRWNNTKLGASYLVGSKIAELKLTVGETVLEYPNTANVPANATVFIDVEKEGYAVKEFTTKPSNAVQVLTITENKKYAFAMPDRAVQVNAKFMAVLKPEWITAIPDQKYTSQAIKPTVVLTDEYTKAVIPATEYTVDYTNNVEAGEATVTVKGKNNNYTGEVTAKFNIIRQELKNEWIAAIPNQAWTGEAVEPTVTVTDKIENKVIDPENYTVEFANNVDAGEATVTVKAKENNYYIGQATAKFNIIKVDEAKAEDGSSFWYRVIDEASKEATILHIEPASADVESFTIPATIDGYDIVAFEDIALSPAAVANVKDFYLPAVKGHAIAGITSEMLTDTRVYQHPSKVARIHVPLEVLGEYAQALDYFTNLYKVSAVKESAPRFWTLGCSVNVMLDAASDAKVYIVKAKDATSVEKVATGTKVIEAGNGVLIEGTAGQDYQVIAAPDAELMRVEVDYSENLLVAVTAPAHFGEGYYILKNGAFYAAGGDDDAVVPAGKAVLYLPTATAPILTISGEATGIKIANADDLKNAQIYDMNGRKVEGVPAQKGIYILNGKKVAIK